MPRLARVSQAVMVAGGVRREVVARIANPRVEAPIVKNVKWRSLSKCGKGRLRRAGAGWAAR